MKPAILVHPAIAKAFWDDPASRALQPKPEKDMTFNYGEAWLCQGFRKP